MTIRFAPARRRTVHSLNLGYSLAQNHRGAYANDNNSPVAANDQGLLADALRHFAEHGLHAAEHARDRAMDAKRAGDADCYNWWLSICAVLDQRMANAIDESAGS